MRAMSKKKFSDFNKEVIRIMKEHGAVECSDFRQYKIPTGDLGDFHVSLDREPSCIYSIYGVFEDVEKAKSFLKFAGGNTFSGKFNCHYYEKEDALRWLSLFLNRHSMKGLIDNEHNA